MTRLSPKLSKPSCHNTLVYCNTNFFFQPLHTLAIHFEPTTLPKSLSHDTIPSITIQLGSIQNHFLHQIFFFSFFTIIFFFHTLFFSYWKIPKKYIYIYTYIYIYIYIFHFPEHSNKFIKIYFIQFSSVLQFVKP